MNGDREYKCDECKQIVVGHDHNQCPMLPSTCNKCIDTRMDWGRETQELDIYRLHYGHNGIFGLFESYMSKYNGKCWCDSCMDLAGNWYNDLRRKHEVVLEEFKHSKHDKVITSLKANWIKEAISIEFPRPLINIISGYLGREYSLHKILRDFT